MELNFFNNKIEFKKELNSLDKFVIDFIKVLDGLNIKYVVISGYVSIIFGRNRSSEDIDLLIERMDLSKFKKLWKELEKDFECIVTDSPEKAFISYINAKHAIRFSRKGEFIPNMEIKFPKIDIEEWCINNRLEVILNKQKIFISKIELQIPFKLFLGSEKDIEDAKYLYKLFKDKIDMKLMQEFNKRLQVENLFIKYLDGEKK